MPSLSDQLARDFRPLQHRPLPPRWLEAEPDLHDLPNHAEAAAAVRDWLVDEERSDRTIRALVRLSRDDPDAVVVLLVALAGGLRGWRQSARGEEYRAEELSNLVLVILEADDLAGLPRIAVRLQNRAHRRTHDRFRLERKLFERECKTEYTAQFESAAPGVEDQAIARARIDEFTKSVRRAIDSGDLPPEAWTMFRDTHLLPHIGRAPIRQDRSRTYRATKQIRRLAHAL